MLGAPRPRAVCREISLGTTPLDKYIGHTMHDIAFHADRVRTTQDYPSYSCLPRRIALSRVILGSIILTM